MPMAPPRACHCGQLQPCQAHTRKPWQAKPTPTVRIRGRAGQALRHRLLSRCPLCVLCEAKGLTVLAAVRDHVIPLAEGGLDDETNEQAICHACHDAKTQEESKRGLQARRYDSREDRA